STLPPSSCRTVQIGGCAPAPIRGLAQLVGHTGTVHTFSSLLVTVRPLAPATSQVTATSSHASAVRPLTLPIADAIAPGSSDAIVAGVVATSVPVPVGGQVLSSSKLLSVIAQFASATPPGTVTGFDVVVVGGQVGSFGNTLSVTTQLARSAVPVFISSTSTSLFPLASCTRQVLVTPSPGVRHWNFAVSFAVARKFAFLSAVQKQLTVAVSGSLALSVSLHVVLTGTGVDVPPTTIVSAIGTAVLLSTVLVSV